MHYAQQFLCLHGCIPTKGDDIDVDTKCIVYHIEAEIE